MNYKAFVVLLLLPLGQLITVEGSATFEVYIRTYSNPSERRYDGECCDPFCSGRCDPWFVFCLDRYRNPINTNYQTCHYTKAVTGYYKDDNVINFGSSIKGVRNPITINIRTENVVVFKANVMDKDTKYDDHMDSFHDVLQFSMLRNSQVNHWSYKTLYGRRRTNKSRFYIKYRAYCNANYYGRYCNIYCRAQNNDRYGHYRCDIITGRKICLPGWIKPETLCRTKDNPCNTNTCLNGGTCTGEGGKYTCTCAVGFTGARCELILEMNVQGEDYDV